MLLRLLACALALASAATLTPPRRLRYGIVGTGCIGLEHIRNLHLVDEAELVAIADPHAPSIEAARAVEAATNGEVGVTVADARFMKPLDTELILQLAADHEVLITVEEGSIGGFGDHVLHFLALSGELDDGKLKVRPMVLPDKYFEAGSQNEQYEEAGLTAPFIEATMLKLTGRGSGQVQKAEKVDEEGTIA